MLTITKIPRGNEGHEVIECFLKTKKVSSIFFCSPFTIQTWLNTEIKELYLASFRNEKILLVYDIKRKKDVRFLLEYPSDEFMRSVIEYFDAKYIGVNELHHIPPHIENPHDQCDDYLVDVATVEGMFDGMVRREYNRCVRRHPRIFFKEVENSDRVAIKLFLEKWLYTRTDEQNKFSRISNELYFIDSYLDNPQAYGGVVYDGDQIVALTFFVQSMIEGVALSTTSKVLRGYTKLGTYLSVEQAKMLKKKGFNKVNIGKMNNEFKRKFLLNATPLSIYAYEAWIKEGWKFTSNFLQRGLIM